jgi:hypothetical protein
MYLTIHLGMYNLKKNVKIKKSTVRESGINYIKLENFYKF